MRMQVELFATNLDPTNDPVKKIIHFFSILEELVRELMTAERTGVLTDGRKDGQTDGRIDERTDGHTDEPMQRSYFSEILLKNLVENDSEKNEAGYTAISRS